MANLIECPTCGNQISENAVSCPHCGEPINQYYDNQPTYDEYSEDENEYEYDEDDDEYVYVGRRDDRKTAMVWTLPLAIISMNLYTTLIWIIHYYSFPATIVYTVISFITLFCSGATASRKYKAWGVSVAALFISIANVLIGVFFLIFGINSLL
jgi:hypothetical protein